jgi:thiol-disulfide isomerase/thioredoxin
MRWLEWIFTDPLAQMTVLSVILTAVLLMLMVRKVVTHGLRPTWRRLAFAAMAWFLFTAPSIYFWHQIIERKGPTGPLLHSTPRARFKTSTGKSLSLESLRGHVVLLDFWASWCAPCRKSSPAIAELQKTYGPDLITISVDEDESEQVWRGALGGDRPMYDVYDSDQKLRWTFRVASMPEFVVIDRDGRVAAAKVGWEPTTLAELRESVDHALASRAEARAALP